MISDDHPWARCLTRPDGVQLIRHHIAASHSQSQHSNQTCPTSSDLVALLVIYPWQTQALLQNQADDITQCLAKRLSQGGVTLQLLIELQTGQFDTLLSNAILGANASIQKAYISTIATAISVLPAAFFSLHTPIEFRISLCRHFISLNRPGSELAPVITDILQSATSCQALVFDLLRYFGHDPDLVYSFIAHRPSCFSSHFLKPIAESEHSLSDRFFELVLADQEIYPVLLNLADLSQYKILNSFVSKVRAALKSVWGDPLYNLTDSSCSLLLDLRLRQFIDEDVLTVIFKAHSLPPHIRRDILRFCILSGLPKQKHLFLYILETSAIEDLAVIGCTLADLITYPRVFPIETLDDALSSIYDFLKHQSLIQSLLGSDRLAMASTRDTRLSQFLNAVACHRSADDMELSMK